MKYSRLKLNFNNFKSQIKNNVHGGGVLSLNSWFDLNLNKIILVDVKHNLYFILPAILTVNLSKNWMDIL